MKSKQKAKGACAVSSWKGDKVPLPLRPFAATKFSSVPLLLSFAGGSGPRRRRVTAPSTPSTK